MDHPVDVVVVADVVAADGVVVVAAASSGHRPASVAAAEAVVAVDRAGASGKCREYWNYYSYWQLGGVGLGLLVKDITENLK